MRSETLWRCVTCVGCLFRLWFVLSVRHPLDWLFSDCARHWANGLHFLDPTPIGAANPVLYQLWLFVVRSLSGDDRLLVGLANAWLSLAFVGAWYLFARELFATEKTALIATAILTWMPSLWLVFSYELTETLLLPLLGLACWSTWRAASLRTLRWCAVCALLWTAAVLTRPVVLPLMLFSLLWVCMVSSRRLAAVLLSIALVAPCFTAAALRSYQHFGTYNPFGNDGKLVAIYFYSGKQTYYVSFKHFSNIGYRFESPSFHVDVFEPLSSWSPSRNGDIGFVVDSEQHGTDLNEILGAMLAQNWKKIPEWAAENFVILLVAPMWPGTSHRDQLPGFLAAYERFLWLPLFAAGLIAVTRVMITRRSRNPFVGLLFVAFASMGASCFLTIVEGRYRLPFEPLLVLCLIWTFDKVRGGFPKPAADVHRTQPETSPIRGGEGLS